MVIKYLVSESPCFLKFASNPGRGHAARANPWQNAAICAETQFTSLAILASPGKDLALSQHPRRRHNQSNVASARMEMQNGAELSSPELLGECCNRGRHRKKTRETDCFAETIPLGAARE